MVISAVLPACRQERLIAALLTLASSQRGLGQTESIDLADIARAAVLAREEEAARHGIRVSTSFGGAPATPAWCRA
jgi:hypothetical protein